jgi:hypothetical protein
MRVARRNCAIEMIPFDPKCRQDGPRTRPRRWQRSVQTIIVQPQGRHVRHVSQHRLPGDGPRQEIAIQVEHAQSGEQRSIGWNGPPELGRWQIHGNDGTIVVVARDTGPSALVKTDRKGPFWIVPFKHKNDLGRILGCPSPGHVPFDVHQPRERSLLHRKRRRVPLVVDTIGSGEIA